MSDAEREEFFIASAKDVRVRAAEWHDRREREGWRETDQAELDAWLAQSPAHAVAFLRVDAAWSRADRLSALGHPVTDLQVETPARLIPPIYFRAAAVFALVAALGAAAAHFLLAPDDRTFATSVGGHETVSFADGSRIELNTNTVLRARMTTEQRIVWLDKGEAFFQVKHDRLHPFIVIAGARRITDLGTQFVVRRDTGKLQVAVVQGRVWFDASEKQTASQSTLLIQGDVATATAGAMSITRKPVQALATDLSWRRGVLVFKHATLADAAAQFNRYNREKLVIANPDASRRVIGGTFPANDVEAFARVVRTALGLRVENRGDGTLVLY
jgi:transmembrane sensor